MNEGYELIDGVNDRHGFETVPFHVLTEPEDAPAPCRAYVGRLRDRELNLLARGAAVSPPHFKDLHTLTRDPKGQVDLLAKVRRWTPAFNEGAHGLAYPRRFELSKCHSSRILGGVVEVTPRSTGQSPRACVVFQHPQPATSDRSRTCPMIGSAQVDTGAGRAVTVKLKSREDAPAQPPTLHGPLQDYQMALRLAPRTARLARFTSTNAAATASDQIVAFIIVEWR